MCKCEASHVAGTPLQLVRFRCSSPNLAYLKAGKTLTGPALTLIAGFLMLSEDQMITLK
jgi:hypothetical protein